MYRLDPDGSVRRVFGDVTVSNGLEWSPDGALAYYADTATHRVDVFDYDRNAGLTRRRPFVRLADDERPDGLTVDGEGGVWVAVYGGGAVRRYDADGRLEAVVEVPTPQVTACTLGGPQLDQLFVTTSREGMDPDDDPLAGSLFRVDAGVRGLPVRPFAG
jgi:sugar lactone lactonase YvrE